MREKHQPPAAQDGLERMLREVGVFGVHFAELNILESQHAGALLGQGEHLGRHIGCDHPPYRPHPARRCECRLAEPCRDIEHLVARVHVRQLNQAGIDMLGGSLQIAQCCCQPAADTPHSWRWSVL